MTIADRMSQAYVLGADDQKRQQRQELEALRELCDDQQRIIASLQKDATGWQVAAEAYKEEIKRGQDS